MTIYGTKNIPTIPSNGQTSVTYQGSDFTPSTSYATLQGPLSIGLDINFTNCDNSAYIGVQVNTIEGAITIADRKHIGFIRGKTRLILSAASVPQLSRVDGTITSIVITFYWITTGGGNYDTPTIQLRTDKPALLTSPLEYIGYDSAVFSPGNYDIIEAPLTAYAAGATIIATRTIPTYLRYKIKAISLRMSAAAVDIVILQVRMTTLFPVTYVITQISSTAAIKDVFLTYSDFIVPGGFTLDINFLNGTGAALNAYGNIVGEYIY